MSRQINFAFDYELTQPKMTKFEHFLKKQLAECVKIDKGLKLIHKYKLGLIWFYPKIINICLPLF
jgi:hypothetical protein